MTIPTKQMISDKQSRFAGHLDKAIGDKPSRFTYHNDHVIGDKQNHGPLYFARKQKS